MSDYKKCKHGAGNATTPCKCEEEFDGEMDSEAVWNGDPEQLSNELLIRAAFAEGYSVKEMGECPKRMNAIRRELMHRLGMSGRRR